MSKERLEEIKDRYTDATLNDGYFNDLISITTKDYMWLIEQAERVQELESQRKEDLHDFVNRIVKQNKRYREVIEKAIAESGWGDEGNALYRTISTLEKLLESESHEPKTY